MTVKGTPAQGLTGATLGFFFGFAAVALFGTTAQTFKAALGLNQVTVALLIAIPSLMGSLLRIPFAAWVDSAGGRKPFLVLMCLSVLGMGGLALAVTVFSSRLGPSSFPLILVLGAVSGCGIATFSVGISQVSYWFPRAGQGTALGVYGGVGNLAPGLFTLILPVVLSTLGLGGAYGAWLAMLAAGTILYFLVGVNAPYFQERARGSTPEKARQEAAKAGQEMFPSGNAAQSLATSAKQWRTWLLVAIYFTSFGGFMAMTAWLPSYWRVFLGTSAVLAGILAAVYSLVTSLVRVVGGSVADRLGGEKTATASLAVMAVGAVMMILTRGTHGIAFPLVAELVMAIGMGITNAAVFKLVPKAVPTAVGGASGWVGGLGAFGGFVLPPVLGLFVSARAAVGYADGFAIFLALALVSLALMVVLQRARPAREERSVRRA